MSFKLMFLIIFSHIPAVLKNNISYDQMYYVLTVVEKWEKKKKTST